MKYDSMNRIEHKCPCCGYEVNFDFNPKTIEYEFVKGDQSFLRIDNPVGRTYTFNTDRPRNVDYGPVSYESVYLLGCPKCGCVSYKTW